MLKNPKKVHIVVSFWKLTLRVRCAGQNQFSFSKKFFPKIIPPPGIKNVRWVFSEKSFLEK
jgi:hypothetical protein